MYIHKPSIPYHYCQQCQLLHLPDMMRISQIIWPMTQMASRVPMMDTSTRATCVCKMMLNRLRNLKIQASILNYHFHTWNCYGLLRSKQNSVHRNPVHQCPPVFLLKVHCKGKPSQIMGWVAMGIFIHHKYARRTIISFWALLRDDNSVSWEERDVA